ncbi:hypothetical protein LXL04_011457 [Taraxacum kok-saghyz]
MGFIFTWRMWVVCEEDEDYEENRWRGLSANGWFVYPGSLVYPVVSCPKTSTYGVAAIQQFRFFTSLALSMENVIGFGPLRKVFWRVASGKSVMKSVGPTNYCTHMQLLNNRSPQVHSIGEIKVIENEELQNIEDDTEAVEFCVTVNMNETFGSNFGALCNGNLGVGFSHLQPATFSSILSQTNRTTLKLLSPFVAGETSDSPDAAATTPFVAGRDRRQAPLRPADLPHPSIVALLCPCQALAGQKHLAVDAFFSPEQSITSIWNPSHPPFAQTWVSVYLTIMMEISTYFVLNTKNLGWPRRRTQPYATRIGVLCDTKYANAQTHDFRCFGEDLVILEEGAKVIVQTLIYPTRIIFSVNFWTCMSPIRLCDNQRQTKELIQQILCVHIVIKDLYTHAILVDLNCYKVLLR